MAALIRFSLEIIYSRQVLIILISFLHFHIHCNNVFMYVMPIVYLFFIIILVIFGIFLVISVNRRLFRYLLNQHFVHNLAALICFFPLDIIMSKNVGF